MVFMCKVSSGAGSKDSLPVEYLVSFTRRKVTFKGLGS